MVCARARIDMITLSSASVPAADVTGRRSFCYRHGPRPRERIAAQARGRVNDAVEARDVCAWFFHDVSGDDRTALPARSAERRVSRRASKSPSPRRMSTDIAVDVNLDLVARFDVPLLQGRVEVAFVECADGGSEGASCHFSSQSSSGPDMTVAFWERRRDSNHGPSAWGTSDLPFCDLVYRRLRLVGE